jgi:hypothetical protein
MDPPLGTASAESYFMTDYDWKFLLGPDELECQARYLQQGSLQRLVRVSDSK